MEFKGLHFFFYFTDVQYSMFAHFCTVFDCTVQLNNFVLCMGTLDLLSSSNVTFVRIVHASQNGCNVLATASFIYCSAMIEFLLKW